MENNGSGPTTPVTPVVSDSSEQPSAKVVLTIILFPDGKAALQSPLPKIQAIDLMLQMVSMLSRQLIEDSNRRIIPASGLGFLRRNNFKPKVG